MFFVLSSSPRAHAQGGDKITIELKDADFSDALDILFKNRNLNKVLKPGIKDNTSPISISLADADWEVALKFIADAANVKYRKEGNVYIFEPKPQSTEGTGGGGGAVGGPAGGTFPAGEAGRRTNAAEVPGGGAEAPGQAPGGGGAAAAPALEGDEEKPKYARYEVKHIYSGGLAMLFGGTSITTMMVASPGGNMSGGGGSGGSGFGGIGGSSGSGGFGGSSGGFGGSSGGFGGSSGGFGGSSGGFGGSSGGFGGSSGGFGGSSGGFGGSSGGGGGYRR
ncbi:MAG: hypothetical protein HY318_13235 [Armatimonadetes bacterium]|nr:hypothetical protein [Armatimonadota bacterium]